MQRSRSGEQAGVTRLSALLVVVGVVVAGLRALPAEHASLPRDQIEHRYRIAGKVRLLFFWIGADDVGGARITWRGDERDRAIALLIGSDPRRAPKGVNEWGYVREHTVEDTTTVFALRTVTDGESPDDADGRRPAPGERPEIDVLCSTISPAYAVSRTTGVRVEHDSTYRDVDRVLDAAADQREWKTIRMQRPRDASSGFLAALDLMMRSSAASARSPAPSCPRLSYMYKDAVYELIPGRVERIPSLQTQAGPLRNLLRSEITVRNRTTGYTAGFKVTYGTEGEFAGVPVVATYQPNWWFKVELVLNDTQEMPPDPAADSDIRERIAALCAQDPAESWRRERDSRN